jgi:plastocyanin
VVVKRRGLFGALSPASPGDALVYASGFVRAAPSSEASLQQQDEQFRPRVLPVVAGQRVAFPNLDPIYHNVFSVSPLHAFDLGQYKSSDPPKRETFETPGLVPVFCNIHPHMIAFVAVLENDAFARVAPDGSFTLPRVPVGLRRIHAWAPGAQPVMREVEVREGAESEAAFELRVGPIPPHRRKDGSAYPPPGSEAER